MRVPAFDIFSGDAASVDRWIDVVHGLEAAKRRMDEIAAKRPGKYFVFDCKEHLIVYAIDSREHCRTKTASA